MSDDGVSSVVQLVIKIFSVVPFASEVVNGISKYIYLGMVVGRIIMKMRMGNKSDSTDSNCNKCI